MHGRGSHPSNAAGRSGWRRGRRRRRDLRRSGRRAHGRRGPGRSRRRRDHRADRPGRDGADGVRLPDVGERAPGERAVRERGHRPLRARRPLHVPFARHRHRPLRATRPHLSHRLGRPADLPRQEQPRGLRATRDVRGRHPHRRLPGPLPEHPQRDRAQSGSDGGDRRAHAALRAGVHGGGKRYKLGRAGLRQRLEATGPGRKNTAPSAPRAVFEVGGALVVAD